LKFEKYPNVDLVPVDPLLRQRHVNPLHHFNVRVWSGQK